METLFTPWRRAYVEGAGKAEGCFLCTAAAEPEDPERLVVHTSRHHLVILNRHPYSTGHLMVAPRSHRALPSDATAAEQAELWPVVLLCQRVLLDTIRPEGLNLGMNLGSAAGAGVPDHYHFHLVPRWSGDSNYMSVVGEVRLVPETLYDTWAGLRERFAEARPPASDEAEEP